MQQLFPGNADVQVMVLDPGLERLLGQALAFGLPRVPHSVAHVEGDGGKLSASEGLGGTEMDTDGVSMGAEPRDGVLGRWKVYVPDVDEPGVRGPVAEVVGVAHDGENRMWRRWHAARGGQDQFNLLG